MANVKICDRCATIIKEHAMGSSIVSFSDRSCVGYRHKCFDLCKDCVVEVKSFITNSKKNPTDAGDE